jgi:hypothetical protein
MLQQGGIAEHHNCTLEEHVIAMLNGMCLPVCFWGKVLYHYTCLLNMLLSSAILADIMLYKMLNKHKSDYSMLCVFGCHAWAHICHKKHCLLKPHAKPCMFLGIPNNFKGWKLWDPSAQGGCGGMIVSQDIIWNKEEFLGLSKVALDPIPAHFGVGHVCLGHLQSIVALCDCHQYISPGGMTEVAHCCLSSYHNLQVH